MLEVETQGVLDSKAWRHEPVVAAQVHKAASGVATDLGLGDGGALHGAPEPQAASTAKRDDNAVGTQETLHDAASLRTPDLRSNAVVAGQEGRSPGVSQA